VSIINRWGVDPAQRAFFERQIKFRRTLYTLVDEKGKNAMEENSLAFKLRNPIKTKEDFAALCLGRVISPIMEKGDPVIPQIIGINTEKNEFTMYSYAPIYKVFAKKVDGLVDVLVMTLGNKGCNLIGFVSGARGGKFGDIAVASIYDIKDRSSLRRSFRKMENGSTSEFSLPIAVYSDIFSKSFDGDIWTEQAAWKDIIH
jgi:hypothetical protein